MLDSSAVLTSDIPSVDPMHVKRLWTVWSKHAAGPGISFTRQAISQFCESEPAEPMAIWARTALLAMLVRTGQLDPWRRPDGSLDDAVSEHAASFPLPAGLEAFDPESFLEALTR